MRNQSAGGLALLSEAELASWRGFLRVHAALERELDAELTELHGLPLSSYEVLLTVADAPDERVRMSEIADSVLLSRSGVTRLVDRLERDGLVEELGDHGADFARERDVLLDDHASASSRTGTARSTSPAPIVRVTPSRARTTLVPCR